MKMIPKCTIQQLQQQQPLQPPLESSPKCTMQQPPLNPLRKTVSNAEHTIMASDTSSQCFQRISDWLNVSGAQKTLKLKRINIHIFREITRNMLAKEIITWQMLENILQHS